MTISVLTDKVKMYWNKYCYIVILQLQENIRMGLGRELINAAIQWAKKGGILGLMLETQDINLSACRFYHSCGFVLGAVDTMLYGNCRNKDEKALFWYMQFNL